MRNNEDMIQGLHKLRDEILADWAAKQTVDAAADRIALLEAQLINLRHHARRKINHETGHQRFFCPLCDDIDAVLQELTTEDTEP